MNWLSNSPLMETLEIFTDKRRDNVPALLVSMWYCGSLCAALMWRHALPDLIKYRLSSKKLLEPRLLWITHFWLAEAVFGVFSCRSVNYVKEELRDKETPTSAIIRFRAFCTLRDFAANAVFITVSLPWDFDFSPRWVAVVSAVGTAIGGKIFSLFSLIIFFYSIRSIVNNTRAYQGQEGVLTHYRGFLIGLCLYFGAFVVNDAQLLVGFCLISWCVVKIYVLSFWQLEEYYWSKHKNHDHPFQQKFYKFLYKSD